MFTAPRTTAGFEPLRNKTGFSPNPVPYELAPDTAFPKGSMVVLTNGKVALATSGSTSGILGVIAAEVKQADNPAAGLTYGLVYDNPDMIFRVSVADMDQRDYTATGGNEGGTTVTALTSNDTASAFRAAMLYVYEGTNKGSIRTVSAYSGDGTTGTWTVIKAFPNQCDTTTKFIVFASAAEANDGINIGQPGVVLKDHLRVDGDARVLSSTTPQGPLVCVGLKPADLMMDVMVRRSKHILGG